VGGVKHSVVLRDGRAARMNINRCGTRQRKDCERSRKRFAREGRRNRWMEEKRVNGQRATGNGNQVMGVDGMGWASSQMSLKPGCDKLSTGQLIPCTPEALGVSEEFHAHFLYFGPLPMLQGLPPNSSEPPTANYATSLPLSRSLRLIHCSLRRGGPC